MDENASHASSSSVGVDAERKTDPPQPNQGRWVTSRLTWLLDLLLWAIVLTLVPLAFGSLWYLYYLPGWIRIPGALVYLGWVIVMLRQAVRERTRDSHPLASRARGWIAFSICTTYVMTLGIRPSNERAWAPDHANVASVKIDQNRVVIENFRHAVYQSESEFDVHFQRRSFPLERIQGVWLLVQRFSINDGLAHLFLSFELSPDADPADPQDGPGGSQFDRKLKAGTSEYVCVSVEIRRELGETYHPIKGLFRSYELTHVIGDERDLIGVRTVHRPQDRVFLYRIHASPAEAQTLFCRFAQRIDKLERAPEFYHTLLNNCANGITEQTYQLTPEPINWLDPRIVLPGYAAAFAFEKNLIGNQLSGQTLDELQSMSRIDQRAREVGITDSFSSDIRSGMNHEMIPDL